MVLPDKLRQMRSPPAERVVEVENLKHDPISFLARSLANEANDVVRSELATHAPKITGDALPEPSQGIPDYSIYTPDQRVEALEAFKIFFAMVKKKCPDLSPPEVNDYSDLRKLHIQENVYRRHMSIKRSVGTKKNYLVGFWTILEIFMRWCGLDFKGYAQSQVETIGAYDEMLMTSSSAAYRHTDAIDLAVDSEWSPEMRAGWMALKSVLWTLAIAIGCAILQWLGVPVEAAKQMIPLISGWMNGTGDESGNRADARVVAVAEAAATNNPVQLMQVVLGGQGGEEED